MKRINRDRIAEILKFADKKGLSADVITVHLINSLSDIFGSEPLQKDAVKAKVNRILRYDINKKSGGLFARVLDPKTGKPFRGRYRLKAALCRQLSLF